MDGQAFIRIVNTAFAPLMLKLGFSLDAPSISGRHYHARFIGKNHVVAVSFEPGDDATLVYVHSISNGILSDLDDREKTPRLTDLNHRYMRTVSKQERVRSNATFESIRVADKQEDALLKSAMELSLVLPRHLATENDA